MLDHTLSLRVYNPCIHWMVMSPNCAKIKSVANNRNSPGGNPAETVKNSKTSWVQEFSQERSKSLKRSKGPRDPCCQCYQEVYAIQELPWEAHIIKSWAFPCNHIYLYCKRPIVGAEEPSVVKANLVQACNQKRVQLALPSISWKFWLLANLVH